MKLFASHCVFPTPDIQKTAEFYVEKLGFRRVDYLDANEKHICLYRDGVEFILTQASTQRVFPNRELYGYGEDAYVITESQQELQDEFEKKGVTIIHRLHKTDYQNLEFSIEDIDERWICFGIKEA
jgi:catechol 2,3-dioxygenase-like lactoylglutathione lyase family enzyme